MYSPGRFATPRSDVDSDAIAFVSPRDLSISDPDAADSKESPFFIHSQDSLQSLALPHASSAPSSASRRGTSADSAPSSSRSNPHSTGARPTHSQTASPKLAVSRADVQAALFQHTRHGRYKEVERLLRLGLKVDSRDAHGNTFLIVACQNGNKRLAKLALRQGAQINAQNNKGNTACHYCFSFGYKNLGNYLISKGAATNIVNQAGETVDQMRVAVATEKKKPA